MGERIQMSAGVIERDELTGLITWSGGDDEEIYQVFVGDELGVDAATMEKVIETVIWPERDIDDKDEAIALAVESAFAAALGRPIDVDRTRTNPVMMLELLVRPASAS